MVFFSWCNKLKVWTFFEEERHFWSLWFANPQQDDKIFITSLSCGRRHSSSSDTGSVTGQLLDQTRALLTYLPGSGAAVRWDPRHGGRPGISDQNRVRARGLGTESLPHNSYFSKELSFFLSGDKSMFSWIFTLLCQTDEMLNKEHVS